MIEILAVILIAGVVLWALTQFPAIDPTLVQIVRVIIIVVVAIMVIKFLVVFLGGSTSFPSLGHIG